jgi:hypothetical protein
MAERASIDLTGYIDPHVHAAPELVPRLLDDIALAELARAAGMAGVLIKSHTSLTADRASIASRVVPGIRVWGGIVLNRAVGGLDPAVVETALAYGAAEVWMPTHDAANHVRFHGLEGYGLTLEDAQGRVLDAIHEIVRLVAEHDAILGTGHLSVDEMCLIARLAREHGVRKVLVTHPEAPFVDMPVAVQRDLAAVGCKFERTWVFTTPALGRIVGPEQLMHDIKAVGVGSTVLATDMGQLGNPTPIEGFRAYVQACLDAGFSHTEVRHMGSDNIRGWLPW